MKKFFISVLLICASQVLRAENGYRLWLRYEPLTNPVTIATYKAKIRRLIIPANSPALIAGKSELKNGIFGLLKYHPIENNLFGDDALIVGTPKTLALFSDPKISALLSDLGEEGYIIKRTIIKSRRCLVIAANTDRGVLYGVFHFLRLLQTERNINQIDLSERPAIAYRLLNHWDNLDRTVERGYAGSSLWNWHKLPEYIDPRYVDYARTNASVGINGTVLNNVNANSLCLTNNYLIKAAALADVFRPYGIRVFLSAKFSAPVEQGGLSTSDPLDPRVRKWWADKADEIYRLIPDFGGFLVKANSEGQPGPQKYGRSHADGANMLADALAPHQGIVMWRAFVYDNEVPDDRAKQAYNEFRPLDGQFKSNVILQVKNGAIDFQPREPFHPLLGAMPKTPLMLELQLTQEYLGFSTHLVFEAPLIKECLDADTYTAGKGSTVAKIITVKSDKAGITGIAGVANIGSDLNWCGHPFAQANWYAYGRLAWNPAQTSAAIAEEWLRMTFNNAAGFVKPMKVLMLNSRENTVNYMTPLGLHHIMGVNTHYGPGPWVNNAGRTDWNSTYYHKADQKGIGFDRSSKGSNAVAQYAPEYRDLVNNPATCPEIYLLWFHHLPWDYKMRSGQTLWSELVKHYYAGVDSVRQMRSSWVKMKRYTDPERFTEIQQLLTIQLTEALRWRDACVQYFQTFSGLQIPAAYEQPLHPLLYYQNQKFDYVPGIGGN